MKPETAGNTPELEYFPDGGWGMKVDPDADLAPKEAIALAKAIENNRTQKDEESS